VKIVIIGGTGLIDSKLVVRLRAGRRGINPPGHTEGNRTPRGVYGPVELIAEEVR
jgi:hypothetical protein